jgi:hypothetical protein
MDGYRAERDGGLDWAGRLFVALLVVAFVVAVSVASIAV